MKIADRYLSHWRLPYLNFNKSNCVFDVIRGGEEENLQRRTIVRQVKLNAKNGRKEKKTQKSFSLTLFYVRLLLNLLCVVQ